VTRANAAIILDHYSNIPPDQRMVLHLREVEGMEYREIADATDLSMQQVKTYLHRGRHKLRALLLKEKISNP